MELERVVIDAFVNGVAFGCGGLAILVVVLLILAFRDYRTPIKEMRSVFWMMLFFAVWSYVFLVSAVFGVFVSLFGG